MIDPNLITDGQAKHLAMRFRDLDRSLALLFETGAIEVDRIVHALGRYGEVQDRLPRDKWRDPQGYEADARALKDYVRWHGARTRVEDWEYLHDDPTPIPWAYRSIITDEDIAAHRRAIEAPLDLDDAR